MYTYLYLRIYICLCILTYTYLYLLILTSIILTIYERKTSNTSELSQSSGAGNNFQDWFFNTQLSSRYTKHTHRKSS
jgi:hypothetical protein